MFRFDAEPPQSQSNTYWHPQAGTCWLKALSGWSKSDCPGMYQCVWAIMAPTGELRCACGVLAALPCWCCTAESYMLPPCAAQDNSAGGAGDFPAYCQGRAQADTHLVGGDLTTCPQQGPVCVFLAVASPAACGLLCRSKPGCGSFNFKWFDVAHTTGTCWLKAASGFTVAQDRGYTACVLAPQGEY